MALEMWAADKSRCIHRRIVVEGDLVLQTPAHFGAGEGDELIDMPLLLDAYDGKTPLLTGASIAGALRSYLREQEHGYGGKKQEDSDSVLLFGGSKEDNKGGKQSPLIIEDVFGKPGTVGIELRSGGQLESKTRTAKEGALYDVQLWQAGTTFPLRFELLIRAEQDEGKMKQALATALEGFNNDHITLGARKRRGYGQVKVTRWRVKEYDLRQPAQLCDWLQNGDASLPESAIVTNLKEALGVTDFLPNARRAFHLHATFALDGSLLIRADGGRDFPTSDKNETNSEWFNALPDMVHLHSYRPEEKKSMPILSGTSLTGALRSRAYRIANTLGNSAKAKELIYAMFGPDMNDRDWAKHKCAKHKERKKWVQASRLLVKETVVENVRTDLVQNRVSIDRFTGGARDTALFNEQPIWGLSETCVKVDLRLINPDKAEIGLLLLLLKDLWTGDLPLGGESGVGRGRLQGKEATLTYRNGKEEQWQIKPVGKQLEITSDTNSTQQELENFVTALNEYLAFKTPE
ncbi:MAG: RAMP superfamily CRISPR-associated protein [Candidatus Promineifilaceae bacterium]